MQNIHEFPYPQAVFRYFTELAAIPHGSGNTGQIRQWALDTAKRLSLDAHADAVGNVVIRKAASAGYEDHPGVILQGHMDMVCAKLPDCKKDMETEGLELVWGDEYLSANGTTLGGDDGIAVAYAFAILEAEDIPHPPLTVILTVDEETGMEGASGLAPKELTGKYLINIDSEDEGIFTVGCAGGVRVHMQLPTRKEQAAGTRLTLTVSGLQGGHSGVEIHKPLLNANLAMLRLLSSVQSPFQLCMWQGGVRDNVIPSECKAAVICGADSVHEISEKIRDVLEQLRGEYPAETGIRLDIDTTENAAEPALTDEATNALLAFLKQLPNGVQEMNARLNMPETSLNLGIMELQQDSFHVDALIRSGVNAKKAALAERLHQLAEAAGGSAVDSGDYPAWEYMPDTELEQRAVKVFETQYGRAPVIETIHAGLECGILADKALAALECISVGPDLLDIHTPRERLSIASAARTWDFLRALLRDL